MRAGFYGHGAFKPKEVLNALPFVAALGEAAAMDVMVFPHWRFPEAPPWLALPRALLQDHAARGSPTLGRPWSNPAPHCAAGHLEAPGRDGTGGSPPGGRAQCLSPPAYRLAGGIQRECARRRASGRAVGVGGYWGRPRPIPVAESVRQGVYIQNVVTFGYPLPYGQVAPALQQRIRGTFLNVVQAHCEQQWQGNFLLRGAVENLPVAWAPAHVDWPRLAPQGPEVAALGALLGGRNPALAMRRHAGSRQRQEGDPVETVVGAALCRAAAL